MTPIPLSPVLIRILSLATGLAVAGNYYAQALLPTIAQDLGLSPSGAGLIVTTAQVSYGIGLFFLVPLGDRIEVRRLITLLACLTAAGLALAGLSRHLTPLLVGTALAGLCSVMAQVILPFAANLADPARRGKVIGQIMGGLLLGILLARSVAGVLSTLGGWRLVYGCATVAMLAMALILHRVLPAQRPVSPPSYRAILVSLGELLREEPELRQRAALGACSFAVFSVLWTTLAFLLAAPPLSLEDSAIGLFGLAGAAGVLAANWVGRLADRGQGALATSLGWGVLLLAWIPLALGQHSLAAILVGVLLLDFGTGAVHVSNQNRIYRLRPEARNRITAIYMTAYFSGGAAGSLLAANVYAHGGWSAVIWSGLGISLLGTALWAAHGRP